MKTLGHFLDEARKKTDKTTVPVAQIPQQYSSSDQGPASPVYEAEEVDDGVRKQKVVMPVRHDGEHVATIHTFRGRAGGWMSSAHNPDGSSASKKYGIGLNDTKREILNKIKQYHKGN